MAITLGPQFLINTQTSLDQDNVSLAGLANGLFVAAYEAQVPTNLGGVFDGIDFQVFNADGTKRGGEINQTAQLGIFNTFDPDVVAAPDATFHVAFQHIHSASFRTLANAHRDIEGNSFAIGEIGGQSSDDNTSDVSLAVRPDGGLFGVFTDDFSSTHGPDIGGTFRIASHDNAFDSENTIVNSGTAGAQTRPDVAALANGRFVTVFETGTAVALRFTSVTYGPDPNPSKNDPDTAITTHLGTDAFVATGSRPVVAALPGSKFVVLWYDGQAGLANRILGRVYDSGGNSQGDFVAATNVATSALADRDIAVTVRSNGEFAVAWTGIAGTIGNIDNSGTYIDAAVFNSKVLDTHLAAFTVVSSIASITNQSLTEITAGDQFDPSLTTLADGRYVLGWTDASASADDASGLAVRGRIIDTRTTAVAVNGTLGHDDYIGSDFADKLNGFGGDDKLAGGAGNDTLDGGTGADTMNGGNGSDVFIYAVGYGADTVEDFATAASDTIDLRAFATIHTLADVLARATQVGNDTVIDFGGGDTLTLKSVQKGDLTDSSFLLTHLPVITSNGGGDNAAVSVAENSTQVTIVTATDPDAGTTLVYSIVGGADAAKFKIGAATGALAFIAAPDFEVTGR